MLLTSPIRFIALDEAQVVDKFYVNKFPNKNKELKRSALSALIRQVSQLPVSFVLSGTGLGIESSYTTLVSSVALANVEPFLVGVSTFLDINTLSDAIKSIGYEKNIDESVLLLFAGRPRFGMRLAEALILKDSVESVAFDIVSSLRSKHGELQNIPTTLNSTKFVYSELRIAATRWVLKGLAGVSQGGEPALELGICALEIHPEAGSKNCFVIRETLVVRSFVDLPLSDFNSITTESASEIGLIFEDYLGWNANSLCSLVSGGPQGMFDGPWKFHELKGDDRRGELSLNGEEHLHIQKILDQKDGKGMHLVFTGTSIGADLIIIAQRPDKKWLLLFVQSKACMQFSTPEAMKTLQYPYHVNRKEKNRNIPEHSLPSAKSLETILKRNDIIVSFLVMKYPANSLKKYPRKQIVDWQFLETTKKVLELVVDESNASMLLPAMNSSLKGMEEVKRTKVDYFQDDK